MAEQPVASGRSLDDEKLELDRKRLALESSFPRKWGPVLFGTLGTVAVAIISGSISWIATNSQRQLTERENQREAYDHEIENARTALDIYFKNVSLLSPDNPRALYHMRMIAEISDNPGMKAVFKEMLDETIQKERQANPDKEIAEIAAALPSLSVAPTTPTEQVNYQDFTAYIQYPTAAGEAAKAKAQTVQDALAKTGMRTPGMEGVDPAKVPNASEIRFYGAAQAAKLSGLVDQLKAETGIAFKTRTLNRPGLPEGILEIWIGKNDV